MIKLATKISNRSLAILSFLLVSSLAFGQISGVKPVNISCLDIMEFDTIAVGETTIKYKILSTASSPNYSKDGLWSCDLLLPDLNSESDSSLKANIIHRLGAKYKGLNEATAFRTCEARKIYFQAMYPSEAQMTHLKKNLIGSLKIK